MESIKEEAFAHGAFRTVVIPASCHSIGARAFADCKNLKQVHLPKSLTDIAEDAFAGCGEITFVRE